MNTKRIITFFAVLAILFLSGCVAPPYYGGTVSHGTSGYYGGIRANYGYQRPSFYGARVFSGGHRHVGHRHVGHRHNSHNHSGNRHFRGGHRAGGHRMHGLHRNGGHKHSGRGQHRGGGHKRHNGGHRGGGHRGSHR